MAQKSIQLVRPIRLSIASRVGAGLLLPIFLGTAFSIAAQTAEISEQPDYSNVKDIIDGQRTLVAVNDLVIGGLVLKTSDGTKIEDKNIYRVPDFRVHTDDPELLARMFDSMYDTLVYAQADTIYAIDPISKQTTSLTLKGDDFALAGIAAGDFRGDGLQEIVVASRSGIRLISAIDRNDFSKGIGPGRFRPSTQMEVTRLPSR